jgi:hypothetical protein
MVFPVLLSGSMVVIEDDWCRGCDNGEWRKVLTVKAPGKGKRYCSSCWTPWLTKLLPSERGSPIEEVPGDEAA